MPGILVRIDPRKADPVLDQRRIDKPEIHVAKPMV
jgi:hypothetical protein